MFFTPYLLTRPRPTAEVTATELELVSDNYANVGIHDGKGNQISGDDLLACYLGVMRLTPELRAVEVENGSGE